MADSVPEVVAGLLVGAAFIFILGIGLLQGQQPEIKSPLDSKPSNSNNQTNAIEPVQPIDNNQTLAKIYSIINSYHANEISSLDMSYVERNDPKALATVDRIQEVINSCERHRIHVGFGLGSMEVAIEGKEQPDLCKLLAFGEIEMGGGFKECSVPTDVMPLWKSWNNRLTPQFDEIENYCTDIRGL